MMIIRIKVKCFGCKRQRCYAFVVRDAVFKLGLEMLLYAIESLVFLSFCNLQLLCILLFFTCFLFFFIFFSFSSFFILLDFFVSFYIRLIIYISCMYFISLKIKFSLLTAK